MRRRSWEVAGWRKRSPRNQRLICLETEPQCGMLGYTYVQGGSTGSSFTCQVDPLAASWPDWGTPAESGRRRRCMQSSHPPGRQSHLGTLAPARVECAVSNHGAPSRIPRDVWHSTPAIHGGPAKAADIPPPQPIRTRAPSSAVISVIRHPNQQNNHAFAPASTIPL